MKNGYKVGGFMKNGYHLLYSGHIVPVFHLKSKSPSHPKIQIPSFNPFAL